MTGFVSRTVGDVISEILMSRTAFNGSFLVVEGDDDIKFWDRRTVARSTCQLVDAGGKPTVINAVIKLGSLNQAGILGIVDNDCDSLLGRPVPSVNLVRTETRDIETLMLSTQAFESLLSEVGDSKKIQTLEQREGRSIRDAFIARALVFGQLRYLNAARNWNVNFDRLKPTRFADSTSWNFDRKVIVNEYAKQVPDLAAGEIEAHLASILAEDPWSILHGKDSLNVLAIGLRSCIGMQQHPVERLISMLRLAFETTVFHGTKLYCAVRNWERANPRYCILAT